MKTTNKLTTLCGVALLTLVGTAPAHALIITVNYEGTVNNIGSGGGASTVFAIGNILTGTYTFDDGATDGDANTSKGSYGAISNIFTLGSYSSGAGNSQLLIKTENKPIAQTDKYTFEDKDVGDHASGGTGNKAFQQFKIDLSDTDGTVFTNDSLPASLTLGDFETKTFELKFSGGDTIKGNLTDMTFSAVPIPAAVWLMGSALLGLVGIARKKKTV